MKQLPRRRTRFPNFPNVAILPFGSIVLIGALVVLASSTAPRAGQIAEPSTPFAPIGPLVERAIADHQLPGAVILVGRGDSVLYQHAFGQRAVMPRGEPMTEDTIFDLASLTKVVATTTSVMKLIEEGRIRLNDAVSVFIPEFARHNKNTITVRHLLTHTSGLRPDFDLEVEFHGADEAVRRATEEVPTTSPGERFVYSDLNFLLLGDIVRRVSGERLDRYAKAHIFDPLAMTETQFLPPESLRPRMAPTERCRALEWPCGAADVPFLRGIVHDPTARRMDGVAGHAGLFSTAADLSRFCRMLLGGGRLGSVQILSPLTVDKMTAPATPAGTGEVRGLGWDIDSPYSGNRGDLFPPGSYGHTGFTGTSLWLDPASKGYVVFLSNRVHPDGKGDVTPLRGKVATIAAAAISSIGPVPKSSTRQGDVLAGIDVLETEGFARLKGKRVGLVTNQTGRSQSGASTIDLLAHAPGVTLVSLFSPEHGIRGQENERVASSRDQSTGLPIHSLYGNTQRPTAEMLEGINTLVIDLQDIGARFYTYPATVGYVMEEAARRKLAVMVLDRPNPINGLDVEGPVQDGEAVGFNGYFPMPIRHGLTIGELARLFNGEKRIGADLTVVSMRGWRRGDWFDDTGLRWINPSPSMRNLVAATLYPGIGAIERTNVSVGRGTDSPFEHLGAPWIDGAALARELNLRALPGVRFYPTSFTPSDQVVFGKQACQGVFMIVTERERLRPVRVGLEVAAALSKLYGRQFKLEDAASLFGSRATLERVRAGEDPASIAASWAVDENKWQATRAKYLLY